MERESLTLSKFLDLTSDMLDESEFGLTSGKFDPDGDPYISLQVGGVEIHKFYKHAKSGGITKE